MTLFIQGPLPGLNDIIDAAKGTLGRGYNYSRMKARWTNAVALQVRAARIPPMPSARFLFTWVEKNRRRNKDNIAGGGRKFVLDGLVTARVLSNDGWTEVVSWSDRFIVDPRRPGVEVTIEPV